MAENITINLNISGDFRAKIKEYTKLITHANNVVKGLKASLESLAGVGDKGFDSKHITDSLASVQRAFAGFQKINGEDLRKAVESLDPTKLRAFGGALTQFQTELTAELVTRITSFSNSLKGLGEAQKALDSGTLVQQLNALSHALPSLKQAISSDNFKTFSENIKSLRINPQDIAGIIRLGAALKNINRFSGNANSLSELARGITNLTRIKETSGFLRNVQNIATAGTLLHDMKPIDFTKITKGISALTRVNLSDEQWKDIAKTSSEIKKAFADLRSVKLPNLVGFQEGIDLLNQSGAKLKDHTGLTQNVREIKTSLEQLSSVKMPNLGNLVKNLNKLSDETYDFDKIGKSVQSFKNTLGQLHGVQIPSLSGFAKGLVELKNVSGVEVQNIANALKGVPESLAGLDKVKTPNLTNFARGLKELGSGTIDFKQVNENLKSLPNRLKKLGEIQAPDLSKFAKGLVDLSQPAVSAVKSAHAIDKALEVLTKYSSTQIKLPSLSNFAKGLRELATFEGELTTLQGKSTLIKNFISGFSDLDKIKLPNIQGVATAIHKLSTAVPDNAGTLAAGDIGAIVENVKKLDNVKLPNIRQIGQAVAELAAISNHKYGTAEGGLIRLVYRIKELDSVKLPNIRQIGQTMTELAAISSHKYGVAEGGLIQLVNRIKDLNNIKIANIRQIGQTMTELAAISSHKYGVAEGGLIQMVNRLKDLNGIKLPNIRQIGQTMTELAAISTHKYGVAEGGLIQLIARLKELDGVHLTNVRQIGQSMTELSKISNHKYGTVESGLIGFVTRIKELDKVKIPNVRQIGQALTELAEISNKHKFHKINTNISGFIAELKKLDSVKLPNIRQIGQTMTELAAISSHKYGVAEGGLIQLITRLKELSSINIPNIRQVGKTMTELAAISSHKYGVAESGLIGFVTRIKELDKVNIPNVRQIGQALTELNAVASKHKFNTLNAQLPKFITEISRLHSIQLPNVKQIGQGVAELAKLSNHKFGTVEQGLIKVIDRLKDLNGVQLPNVKQIGQALQMFNEYSSNATIAASKLGILRTELSQWTNIKLPNVKNVAEGLKTLNDTTIKYKFDSNAKYVSQIKVVADEIKTAFAGFNNIQLPNVKNVADGFRILNELTIKNNEKGHANLTANIHKLKQALSQLKDLDGTAFPNVKNISEGMQNLTKLGPIAHDLNSTFQTVANALQHVNGIKVPKLKDFTDGFEQLKAIVSKSTGTMETSKFAQDITALSTALSGFGKVSLPPNLSGFAKGIEAITKVNVGLFTKQFNELMVAINSFKIDTNNAALNHFTAVLTLAASAIQQINGKLGQAQSQFGSFGHSVDQVINPMDKLVERFKMFMQYRVISTVFSSITNQLRNVPSAIIEFEKGMYNIQSITGATNESMSKLGDVIKHVAGNTKFSVQEIADGMTTIAQAGFTAGQSMQMIQSISNLATGTLSDMKTTVDLATSAMVVFGIESHQAARVSDVFANAVNKSKLNMDKIKTAFNYIGPVARDANISFEETAVAMMMLANNGQKASTIGTGLRNVFSTLLSPSKKLQDAAAAAGVALADLDPRANSLRDVLSKLSIVVRDSQVALDVFGKRGATAVLGLTQSIDQYDKMYATVGRVGTAAQMAAKQQEGLYVQWKNLKDRAQLAAVTIGESGLTAAITGCVKAVSTMLNLFNTAASSGFGKFALSFTVITTSVSAAALSILGIGKAIAALKGTAIVAEMAGAFRILNANLSASIGLITAEAAAARVAAIENGTAAAATKGFGAALKSIALSPLFITATAIMGTIGLVLTSMKQEAEQFAEKLKEIGRQADDIKSSIVAFTDFKDTIATLTAGTDEYYNAMLRMLTSLRENKEATKLASKEYDRLLASVDVTKKAFNDSGIALMQYIEKLRELEHIKVAEKVKAFEQKETYSVGFGGMETVEISTGLQHTWGYLQKLNDEVTAGTYKFGTFFSRFLDSSKLSEKEARKLQERFAEMNEAVDAFLQLELSVGKISYSSLISDVEELARSYGITGVMLDGVLTKFMALQKGQAEGLYAVNLSLTTSYKHITDFDTALKQAKDTFMQFNKGQLDMSALDAFDDSLRTEYELSQQVVQANKELMGSYEAMQDSQKKYLEAKKANSKDAAALEVIANERQIEFMQAYEEHSKKRIKLEEQQLDASKTVVQNEKALAERRIMEAQAANAIRLKKIEKWAEEELKIASNKASEQLRIDTQKNEKIKRANEELQKTLEQISRTPLSADQYLEKTLKEYKDFNDAMSIQLQAELNNIHKKEEAYKKSNKEIGLSFEDARRAEQNAIAKAAAARVKDLEDRKKQMKELYGDAGAAEQVAKIEQEIQRINEESLKKQHELKEKYAKLGAMQIAERAREVEAAAKKETEARKRAQEQALHDIAVLEAKGVKTHKEAEREKTEVTIKYIEEETRAKQAQIAALSSSDEARLENIDQIQRLKDDIQKNTDEIVKIRRKGIEDQTKIIREGTEKLRELQGSYNKAGAEAQLGDFSAKQQAKITRNYEKQLQRRKELGEENAKELESVQRESLSRVAQEIQRHCAKREDIQAKTTEKVASLEKELAQKQEDFEKKKLDIIKKYNAKRRDLQTSLQDKLHNIETSGMSGRKKEKADIDYARTKRSRAMSGMEEAIRSGDSQALDRIAKELESAMGAFENASKPKKYKDEIIGIYDALQSVLDAQEQIEKQEAERKNNQEVDALTKKIQTANDAMEKSMAVENERHTKAMANFEKEAEKIKEQIKLAEQVLDVYTKSAGQQTFLDQPPAAAPQSQRRAPRKDESSIPAMDGTFDKGVEQMVQAATQAGTAIEKALEIGKSAHKQMIDGWIADHVLYGKTASGEVKKLNDEQMRILAKSGEEFRKAFPDIGEILKDSDVAGQTEVVTDQFLSEWRKAYEEYKTTADNASIEASQKAIEAYQNISPEMKKVINDAIASGAISGSNSAQQNITAFTQIAQQSLTSIGTGISDGMVQGATDGLDRSRPILEQLTQDSYGAWQFGPSLAASIQEGVNQAQATTKAWREVELADGRKLYTNLTDAQRQSYADMAAAAKSTAAIMSTEYETLYTRTTVAGKDFYRAITQEEAKAIANKKANALKESELFVKTTERNLEIFQDMSTKMTIDDWSEKFNAAKAEKAAYDTAKKAMGTWTSTVQESEPAYVSVELAEATLNKAETEVEAVKLKIAKKAAEFGVKVHDGSVSEVKAKAEQLITMIENDRAEILIDLDEKGKRQAVSEVKNLVKELETKETVMLEAEADKKKLDEVNDTVKKLTDDISKKQQILLKPGLDETEKRKILGDIEKLTNDAKDKLSKLQVEIHDEEAKKQIAQIIAMLDKIPKETKTKIGVQVNEAINAINQVKKSLESLKDKTVKVYVQKVEKDSLGGLVGAYATGGRVRRPEEEPEQYANGGQTFRRLPSRYISRGSGHKDDVPALLMKNEFVHRAAAVKKYGLNFMYKLNNLEIPTSITRMFADGGLVSNAITSIQKFATGGLVKSARRKLEDMFSGSGVNLNVDNLNVVGKLEQAADNYTSPIAVQAINTLAKNVEASISKFSNGGILTSSVLTTTQMSAISAKYNALISEARREGNANIAKALSNEQASIKKLTSDLEITLGNLNTSYNKEVQKLTEAHTKRMSDKKAEYERTMASANESYNKRVSEDNRRYAKEDEDYHTSNAKRDRDYREAVYKRETEYARANAKRDENYKAAVYKRDEEFASSNAKRDEEFAKNNSKRDEEFASSNAKRDEEFARANAKRDENYKAAVYKRYEEFASSNAKRDEEFASSNAKRDEEFASSNAKLDENYKMAVYKRETEYARANAKRDENYKAAVYKRDEEFAKANAKLDENYKMAVYKRETEYASSNAKRDEEFASSNAKRDEEFASSNAKRDEEFAKNNSKRDEEYNKSISQLKKDHEKELADLEKTLKDKKEAARKEEEQEAKEEAKTQKSYEKEDERYAKETADRKKSHEKELADAKKEYEDAQFKYEAELESKKQEVDAKKAEIENFKNQMASRVFPANSKKLKEATVEEVMEAHVKQTRADNNGDEYIYDLDLGGTIQKPEPKPPTDEEVKKLYKAIRPRTDSERKQLDKLTTIALNPPYSQQAWIQMEKYNEFLNETTGYAAWRRAAEANKNGVPLEDKKVRQDKPYREYLESHYKTDYKYPYVQAQKDLDDFLKEDSPKAAYDKRVAELKQAHKEAKQEAKGAREEVLAQRKEHADQLAETRANRAEELRQAQLEYDEGVKEAKSKYDESYQEQTNNYNTEKAEATQSYNTEKAEATQSYNEEKEEAAKSYNTEKAEATQSYNEEKEGAAKSYNEEKEELAKSYNEEKEEAAKSYNTEKAEATQSYNEEKEGAAKSYNEEKEELAKSYNEEKEEAAKSYNTEKAEATQSYNEEKEEAAKSYNEEKEGAAKSYNEEKEEAAKSYNEEKEGAAKSYNEEKEEAAKRYNEEKTEATQSYNEEKEEAAKRYNEEKTEAEAAYNESKGAAEKEYQESLIDRKNSIAERDKEYSDDIAARKRDYNEYVAENSISYAEDMAAVKESYQSNVADARSRYGEDVASLKESTKSEVESIKGSMNDSISRAQADMQEDFKSQEDAARQALEEKKDTYSTTKKEAEDALIDSIEHPSTTVAAQESVEKATENMSEDAVLQKYGMSVEELIRRLSKGLWKFATGGLVPSTATSKPNTDSVLSLLMPNEFVMSAKAVRTFGTDFMNSINNLRLPAFAVGGAVESGSIQGTTRSFKAGEMAVNKTIHALDLTINNTHIGELMGERNVIDRFIGEMQRARMSLGATA